MGSHSITYEVCVCMSEVRGTGVVLVRSLASLYSREMCGCQLLSRCFKTEIPSPYTTGIYMSLDTFGSR